MAEIAARFVSEDGATVLFAASAVASMIATAKKTPGRETGGILIGRYSTDLSTAWVETATDEPPDSRAGRTWFVRGQAELRSLLNRLWQDGRHYVGEWHSHPDSSPSPSGPDLSSIQRIARKRELNCIRPILAVIGGNLLVDLLLSVTLVSLDGSVKRLVVKISSD